MAMPTDEQLIQAYAEGDEEAFRALVERYLKPIYNFAYRYAESDGDAADITQDVFVSAWKNIKKFDRNRKFKTWIFAIAKNISLNWIKKKRPALFSAFENESGENSLVESVADPSPLPDELFARAERTEKLSIAIKKLNSNYRTVMLMRYNDHLTFRDIAESLGEPLHTVKSRHRRAIMALEKILAG